MQIFRIVFKVELHIFRTVFISKMQIFRFKKNGTNPKLNLKFVPNYHAGLKKMAIIANNLY